MKSFSTLVAREMQVKTTAKYLDKPVGIVKITPLTISSVGKDREETELPHSAGGNVKSYKPLCTIVWQLFKELNMYLPYDPHI